MITWLLITDHLMSLTQPFLPEFHHLYFFFRIPSILYRVSNRNDSDSFGWETELRYSRFSWMSKVTMFMSDLRFNLEPLDILRLYQPIRKLKIIFDKYKISTRLKDLNLDLGFILDRPNLKLGQSLRVRPGGANRQKSENFNLYWWCLNVALSFSSKKGHFWSKTTIFDPKSDFSTHKNLRFRSKIRIFYFLQVNADHAGHFRPLVLLKVKWRSSLVLFQIFLNKIWSIAQNQKETKVAMVVSWKLLSNMSKYVKTVKCHLETPSSLGSVASNYRLQFVASK